MCREDSFWRTQDQPKNLGTHKLAENLGLSSERVSLLIRVLEDQHRVKQTRFYKMSLTDMQGKKHNIQAIGIASKTEVS